MEPGKLFARISTAAVALVASQQPAERTVMWAEQP